MYPFYYVFPQKKKEKLEFHVLLKNYDVYPDLDQTPLQVEN